MRKGVRWVKADHLTKGVHGRWEIVAFHCLVGSNVESVPVERRERRRG